MQRHRIFYIPVLIAAAVLLLPASWACGCSNHGDAPFGSSSKSCCAEMEAPQPETSSCCTAEPDASAHSSGCECIHLPEHEDVNVHVAVDTETNITPDLSEIVDQINEVTEEIASSSPDRSDSFRPDPPPPWVLFGSFRS